MTGHRKVELAWAAGILDGEGTIQVKRQQTRVADRGYEHFVLQVSIVNTHKPTLERLYEWFGGSLMEKDRGDLGQLACWRLEWSARKAEKVLLQIAPYVFTKRDQVLAALRFRKSVGRPGQFGRSRMPQVTRNTMEQLANSVNSLWNHIRQPIPSQAAESR